MPTQHPWRLAEVTLKDVRKYKYQAAVLPFGATEPHNLHLPYATDNIECEEICDRACGVAWGNGARVALLPTVPYGADQNLMGFPMTISVDQALLDGLVASVAQSLERHGVRKLVVVNGHGGNHFQPGIRALVGRTRVFVCLINWFQMMDDVIEDIFEHPDDHAGEMETSLVQALRPDLVVSEWADNGATREPRFEAARKGWVWFPRPWHVVTTNSGVGYPHKASATKGAKYLKTVTARMGDFLCDFARAPVNKHFPYDSKGRYVNKAPYRKAGR